MNSRFYLDLAKQGLRMPIGTDLVLHEEPNPALSRNDGLLLGSVVERAARRFRTPLAFPLMDLALEKADLLSSLGIPENQINHFHFSEPPSAGTVAQVLASESRPFPQASVASQAAVRYIAERADLMPIGMLIGPFSLMTKLIADPITPVAMAGGGLTAEEDDGVRLIERTLEMALATVLRSAKAQIEAGARAMVVCEPAASTAYLSPRQMRAGSNVFERFVLQPNRRLRQLLADHDVDLIFHNCGELTTDMVRLFATELHPAILSLGGSRKLWQDAEAVPPDIVLFGNLPTKNFYSDAVLPIEEVRRLTLDLLSKMSACGHPHILGSECDVLHVPESDGTIRAKVDAMLAVR